MLALTKSETEKLFLKGCFERKLPPYRPDCLQCCSTSNLIIFSVLSPVGQMGVRQYYLVPPYSKQGAYQSVRTVCGASSQTDYITSHPRQPRASEAVMLGVDGQSDSPLRLHRCRLAL